MQNQSTSFTFFCFLFVCGRGLHFLFSSLSSIPSLLLSFILFLFFSFSFFPIFSLPFLVPSPLPSTSLSLSDWKLYIFDLVPNLNPTRFLGVHCIVKSFTIVPCRTLLISLILIKCSLVQALWDCLSRHFCRPCSSVHGTVGQGRLTWIPGTQRSCRACQNRHPRATGRGRPKALTLSGAARFIAWHLRRPFLGKCRQGLRKFWTHQACLGYDPVLGPT